MSSPMPPSPNVAPVRRTSGAMPRRTSGTSVASIASSVSTAGGRTFPEKLMDMMQTATSDPNSPTYSASIHWMPHGKAFVITDPDAFSADVLVRYFKSTKFKSFTRKLYRWGFRQITKGPDKGSYHHELFVRDDPALCVKMNCHYSDKELRTQADNAAKRRGSYGSVATDKPVRRTSGARDALANATERLTLGTRRGSYAVSGEDDDDDLAIMRAAAVFGGGGSRTSAGGRASLSGGRLSGAGRPSASGGRRGSGTQFQQAQRRVSATRRTSYGSAVSGLGFDDDDHSMGDGGAASGGGSAAVPTSINIGGVPALTGVNGTVAEKSSSAVDAVVAAAQVQAAAQYSAIAGNASSGGPKTAEEIMAQHRLEDAILAQQEAAIRARREQLQKEQEDRLKKLELMAAAKSGASASAASPSAANVAIPGVPTDPAQIKAVQDQMCQARAAQLQQEQEERLKALELMAATKAQGGGALNTATVAKMKQMQEEMSRARAAQVQKEQEDRLKALELMAAAKAVGQLVTPSSAPIENSNPAPQPQTALDILAEASATATAKSNETVGTTTLKGRTDVEQQLLLNAMKKYQQQG